MAKTKKQIKKLFKPSTEKVKLKKVAKYIGNKEIYIPHFKKLVSKNDLVPEMSIEEAYLRRDFIIVYEKED